MEQDIILLEDIPVVYDMPLLCKNLHINTEQAAIMKRFTKLVDKAAEMARPRAAARRCGVESLDGERLGIAGEIFSDPTLRQNVDGLLQVFPYLATEGLEMAEWSLTLTSALDRAYVGVLRNEALTQATNRLRETILERYGGKHVAAMHPGLKVWAIEQQEQLFRVMAPFPERFGVTLQSSFVMSPEFSISGIFFQTEDEYFDYHS